MAANVSGGSERIDPNLTPLLDVVLQLIMFFMMCVNFVTEQFSANVKLASSLSAQESQAKSEADVVVINVEVLRGPAVPGKVVFEKDAHGNTVEKKVLVQPKTTIISVQPYGTLKTRWKAIIGGKDTRLNTYKIEYRVGRDQIKVNDLVWTLEKWKPGRPNKDRDAKQDVDNEDAAVEEAQRAIRDVAYDIKEAEKSKKADEKSKLESTPVIIRADAETNYGLVLKLMAQANKEGFSQVSLRALSQLGK